MSGIRRSSYCLLSTLRGFSDPVRYKPESFALLIGDGDRRLNPLIAYPVNAYNVYSPARFWRCSAATSGDLKDFSSDLPRNSGSRLPDEHTCDHVPGFCVTRQRGSTDRRMAACAK